MNKENITPKEVSTLLFHPAGSKEHAELEKKYKSMNKDKEKDLKLKEVEFY